MTEVITPYLPIQRSPELRYFHMMGIVCHNERSPASLQAKSICQSHLAVAILLQSQ